MWARVWARVWVRVRVSHQQPAPRRAQPARRLRSEHRDLGGARVRLRRRGGGGVGGGGGVRRRLLLRHQALECPVGTRAPHHGGLRLWRRRGAAATHRPRLRRLHSRLGAARRPSRAGHLRAATDCGVTLLDSAGVQLGGAALPGGAPLPDARCRRRAPLLHPQRLDQVGCGRIRQQGAVDHARKEGGAGLSILLLLLLAVPPQRARLRLLAHFEVVGDPLLPPPLLLDERVHHQRGRLALHSAWSDFGQDEAAPRRVFLQDGWQRGAGGMGGGRGGGRGGGVFGGVRGGKVIFIGDKRYVRAAA